MCAGFLCVNPAYCSNCNEPPAHNQILSWRRAFLLLSSPTPIGDPGFLLFPAFMPPHEDANGHWILAFARLIMTER